MIERYSGMLESALYICDRTGAFPYTESHTKWRDLLAASDDLPERARTWTPLTRAFQELDFHFLDNVDSHFAARIREEERLNSFRIFLRDLWAKIGGSADPNRADVLAKDFAERLTDEHRKAEEEWKKIDRDAAATTAPGIIGGIMGSALIVGGLSVNATAISALISLAVGLGATANRAHQKRREFRVSTPMSVFVDLKRHKKRGERF